MREISLHILDLVQNSLRAGATRVLVRLTVNEDADILTLQISDNGSGMSEDALAHVPDPFGFHHPRSAGLGLSFLEASVGRTGGTLTIESKAGQGTRVTANYRLRHIDRPPIGDLAGTLLLLMMCTEDCRMEVRIRLSSECSVHFRSDELFAATGTDQTQTTVLSLSDTLQGLFPPSVCDTFEMAAAEEVRMAARRVQEDRER